MYKKFQKILSFIKINKRKILNSFCQAGNIPKVKCVALDLRIKFEPSVTL